jgi:hypothetical protein
MAEWSGSQAENLAFPGWSNCSGRMVPFPITLGYEFELGFDLGKLTRITGFNTLG